MPRYEWRAALAAYSGGFAIAAAATTMAQFVPYVYVRVLYELLMVAGFWFVFRSQGLRRTGAFMIALLCAISAFLFGTAAAEFHVGVSYLLRGSAPGTGASLAWSAVVYAALLLALTAVWGWRDGRWTGLVWLAAVDIVATVLTVAALLIPTAPRWSLLYALGLAAAWETAARIVLGWVIAVAFSRAVVLRNRTDGDTEQALQPDASRSVH